MSPMAAASPSKKRSERLWRELVGEQLRGIRGDRGETLRDVAKRAGVSPQYLSEIERGLKEPSSEMIAAISGALGLSLLDLTTGLSDDLRSFHGLEAQGGEDYRGPAAIPMLMAA